jgi:hypothetical protein
MAGSIDFHRRAITASRFTRSYSEKITEDKLLIEIHPGQLQMIKLKRNQPEGDCRR